MDQSLMRVLCSGLDDAAILEMNDPIRQIRQKELLQDHSRLNSPFSADAESNVEKQPIQ